jgi:hypothetical protein
VPRRDLQVALAALAVSVAVLTPSAAAQSVPGAAEPGDNVPPAGAEPGPEGAPSEPPPPKEPAPGWVILPGISYTPEHGLALAGSVLRYFRIDRGRQRRPSRLGLTGYASLDGRGELTFDPSLWMWHDRLNIAGTAGLSYYDYPYYGIGNQTPESFHEEFTAFRAVAHVDLAVRLWRGLFVGPLYDFRYEDITHIEEGGLIDRGVVGGDGGVVSGAGAILRWDSRDHTFAPRHGGIITLSPRFYRPELGSDFDFTRTLLDASWFFGLGGAHVLAFDGRADFRTGNPPFDYLALAGGSRLLRGMIEGRYRDMNFLGAQAEYRFPLFWRFGGVAFGGTGRVAHEVIDFRLDGWHWAGGAGLRFAVSREERINLRVDAGATVEGWNYYLGVGEAF